MHNESGTGHYPAPHHHRGLAWQASQRKNTPLRLPKTPTKLRLQKQSKSFSASKVAKVNTMNVQRQKQTHGRRRVADGYKPDWKKAIVTLKEDSKGIEFFESMM